MNDENFMRLSLFIFEQKFRENNHFRFSTVHTIVYKVCCCNSPSKEIPKIVVRSRLLEYRAVSDVIFYNQDSCSFQALLFHANIQDRALIKVGLYMRERSYYIGFPSSYRTLFQASEIQFKRASTSSAATTIVGLFA